MESHDAQAIRQKRPASHWWALICFFGATVVNITGNTMGHIDVPGVLVTIGSLLGLAGFILFRRSSRTYLIGIIALSLLVLRSIQSVFFLVQAQLHGMLHLKAPFGIIACELIGPVLIVVLLRAYTFGIPSRRYYGLIAAQGTKNT